MRRLVIPAALAVVPVAFGCASSTPSDGGPIDVMTVTDVADAQDVNDAADAADAADPTDAADVADVADAQEFTDAQDEQRSIVCEGRRAADGGIECHQEGLRPGSEYFCVRYRCDAEDGGMNFGECCRLVG